MVRLVVSVLLAASLVITSPGPWGFVLAQVEPGPFDLAPSELESMKRELAGIRDVLEVVISETPRSAFDVTDLSLELGFEASDIWSWVRSEIAWVPYAGSLKGAEGVLLDRVGNTLDQSLLLANLLDFAGYDVRLARVELPDDVARMLASSAIDRTRAATDRSSGDEDVSGLLALGRELGVESEQVEAAIGAERERFDDIAASVWDIVQEQSTELTSMLPEATATDETFNRAVANMADYWWVEYGTGDDWTAAHVVDVSSSGEQFGAMVAQETYLLGEIPMELQYELSLAVTAERWEDGAVVEDIAVEQTVRPNEMISSPLTISFAPVSVASTAEEQTSLSAELTAIAMNEVEWLPVISFDETPHMDASVYTDGVLNSSPNLTAPTQRVRDAASALGDIGSSSESHLTAIWIDYTISGPDGLTRRIRRPVFDILGEHRRGSRTPEDLEIGEDQILERGLALMGQTDILPLVSSLPSEYVQYLVAVRLHEAIDPLIGVLDILGDDTGAPSDEALAAFEDVELFPQELYMWALYRDAMNKDRGRTYLAEPNLASRHLYGSIVGAAGSGEVGMVSAFDVVHNHVGVLPDENVDVRASRVRQGVLDTVAEVIAMSQGAEGVDAAMVGLANAAGVMYRSERDGIAWTSVNDSKLEAGDSLGHAPHALARMRASVDAGRMIYAPILDRAPDDREPTAWWDVDVDAGHTLGMGSMGWGQTGSYAIIQVPAKALLRYAHSKTIRATIGCLFVVAITATIMAGLTTAITVAFPIAGGFTVALVAYATNPQQFLVGVFQQCIEVTLFRAP